MDFIDAASSFKGSVGICCCLDLHATITTDLQALFWAHSTEIHYKD